MKILVTGDWHLDARTAGFDRFEDLRSAVDWTVAFAAAAGVDLYVNLGDLCDPDTTRSHRAVGLACETAAALARHGIAQVWLAGNHDVIEDGTGSTTLAPLAGWARVHGGHPLFVVGEEPLYLPEVLGKRIDLLLLPFTDRKSVV